MSLRGAHRRTSVLIILVMAMSGVVLQHGPAATAAVGAPSGVASAHTGAVASAHSTLPAPITSKVRSARPSSPDGPLPDGSFGYDIWTGQVGLVVGGGLIYVDSWAPFGGPQRLHMLSQNFDQWQGPQDGTFVRPAGSPHVYVYVGGAAVHVQSWAPYGGPKPVRVVPANAIASAGQGPWSNLAKTPKDGTFVVTVEDGKVYRFAGGAPIYVDTWAPFGGVQPFTRISRSVIDRAGQGLLTNVRRVPADGTFVLDASAPRNHYQLLRGFPLPVGERNWSEQPSVPVTPAAIHRAGTGQWTNLSSRPVDGTFIQDAGTTSFVFVGGAAVPGSQWPNEAIQVPINMYKYSHYQGVYPADGSFVLSKSTGKVFRFAGGAPMYVDSWAPFGGVQPYTVIEPAVPFDSAVPTVQNSLTLPFDGTFVMTGDGRVYRYAGGAPFYVTDWQSFGGVQKFTRVSSNAVDRAGTGSWSNLRRTPWDNTFVYEAGGNAVYTMIDGAPIWLDTWNGFPNPRPPIAVSALPLQQPGSFPWANLKRFPADGVRVGAQGQHFEFQGGRLVRLDEPFMSPTSQIPLGLVTGAGQGKWQWILPPVD